MSYLNSPRLTFAGQFLADPSTVNNDPNHYNNVTFQPNYQEYGNGASNGWWNPDGTGSWRFVGCKITSVTYKDGTIATDPKDDPVIGMSIMDTDSRAAGKIVDLDPEQQTVSMIWGLTVRIVDDEICFVKGDFEPVAFSDIWWVRSQTQRASSGASAVYQSVINNLEWTDLKKINSRYLNELKSESPKRLSIKFNVDIFCQDHTSPQFTLGRIVGSIGPSKPDEPKHFSVGRQFIPDLLNSQGIYLPSTTNIYMACGLVDENIKQVTLDLGNALMTTGADGQIAETRKLSLAVKTSFDEYKNLGDITYAAENWYEQTAGIVSIKLTNDQIALAQKYPLVIMNESAPLVEETPGYVRADQFVFRINPGENAAVDFYASFLGKPSSGQTIVCEFQDSLINIMGQGNGVPATATPNILKFDEETVTDKSGKAIVKINAGDPQNPRGFIDGQVYAVWYYIKGQPTADFSIQSNLGVTDPTTVSPTLLQSVDPNNFISILVFDSVPEASINNPTWEDIQPTMQQYANLYPLMSKGVFNLADRTVVDANAEILKFVFSKEKTDPNYMPATRDLSGGKQQMIINYLNGILTAEGQKETVTIRKP